MFVSIALGGCVFKSDYNELQDECTKIQQILTNENNQLKSQLIETQKEMKDIYEEYNSLAEEKRKDELVEQSIPYISDDESLKYIEDHFKFYQAAYKDLQLRRIEDNSFKISLKTCRNAPCLFDSHWRLEILTLTIYKDGKYKLQ